MHTYIHTYVHTSICMLCMITQIIIMMARMSDDHNDIFEYFLVVVVVKENQNKMKFYTLATTISIKKTAVNNYHLIIEKQSNN